MGLKVASDSLGAVSAHDLLHYGTTGRASDALVIPTGAGIGVDSGRQRSSMPS